MENLKALGTVFPGSRIGVLLIHGLTGTPTEMSAVAKELNRYGFSVFCPLLAGHCVSEAELLKTTWEDWYASVENAFREFSKHVDVVFAGGISAGAVLSLRLAQRFPNKLRGLALCATTLWWDGWTIPRLSFLLPLLLRLPFTKNYRFVEAWPYGIKNEKLRERVYLQMTGSNSSEAGFSGTPWRSLRELWRLVDLVKAKLPQTKTPTIMVHASDDDIASIRNAIYIKEHIGGPSRLVPMYDSYHMITIDQERKQVSFEAARYFFEQLSAQEKNELASSAASAKLVQSLVKVEEYKEPCAKELLQGLSKRRSWIG